MPRNLRIAALLLLISPIALAQSEDWTPDHVSLYLTSTTTHASNVARGTADENTYYLNSTDGPDLLPEQYGSYWSSGLGLGLTVRLMHIGPTAIAFDLRGSNTFGRNSLASISPGIKVGLRLPHSAAKPYVEGGYAIVNAQTLAADSQYTVAASCFLCEPSIVTGPTSFNTLYRGPQFLGGIDYPLRRGIDFRAVELGIGRYRQWKQSAAITQNVTTVTLSTGIVLHF